MTSEAKPKEFNDEQGEAECIAFFQGCDVEQPYWPS